ncbi:MAG: hypothetical protein NZM43_08715 [Saprospiraceae bacterium]|nr:hypothetical protein [Saprospiraceae bacterium]MDW8484393.1 hypothetical protein [Saprospiraceae bacterium]
MMLSYLNVWCKALLFPLVTGSTIGQSDSLFLLKTLPVQARFAVTDNLGNLYLITRQNAIEKYNREGRLLTRYSTNRFGSAAAIDATNPMKIIVWYADARVAAFFDRNLTPLSELNLIQAGYPEVRTVAAAADGNLWIYDEVAFQLKKISPEGVLLAESQRLNALLSERVSLENLHDDGNTVHAFAPRIGLLSFDAYAQFRQRRILGDAKTCTATSAQAICLTESSLLLLDFLRLSEQRLPLPPAVAGQRATVWLSAERLLVQNPLQLEIWTWRP